MVVLVPTHVAGRTEGLLEAEEGEEGNNEDQEEGEGEEEAEDSHSVLEDESWEEVIVEEPRLRAMGNPPIENIPTRESRPGFNASRHSTSPKMLSMR